MGEGLLKAPLLIFLKKGAYWDVFGGRSFVWTIDIFVGTNCVRPRETTGLPYGFVRNLKLAYLSMRFNYR